MLLTRKDFIGGSAALAGVAVARRASASGIAEHPFNAADYTALRRQLRAFYPDECHDRCKDPAFDESDRAIREDLRAYAAAHPDYDALDLRRESYLSMRRHFRPFLFS